MPNNVTTSCIVTGPAHEIEHFRATVICVPEQESEITLDFNRIVPMPDILKATSKSANADLGIEILTGKPKPHFFCDRSFQRFFSIQEKGIKAIEQLRAWAEKEHPEAIEEGRRAIEAYNETGFYDWYDWSRANWGTKWNSYTFGIDHEANGELSFHFDTAWGFPNPIFEKLAEMFPSLRFECTCIDGWNFAGHGAFNGDPPFEFVEPTDELYEAVYGYKPEHQDD